MKTLLKILFILAAILLMAAPIALEFLSVRRGEKKKISHRRLRIMIFTMVYSLAVFVVLWALKDVLAWLQAQSLIQWLTRQVALSGQTAYFGRLAAAILANIAIGVGYRILGGLVRINLDGQDLTTPGKKNGEFTLWQRFERWCIEKFHHQGWFLVARILRGFAALMSLVYALVFVLYLLPAVFVADWIPYPFVSRLFAAGHIYPVITLLVLWEFVFFLSGLEKLGEECPALLKKEEKITEVPEADVKAIDEDIQKTFKDQYVCNVDLSRFLQNTATTAHHPITEQIARAVENNARNPRQRKELYMRCLDRLVENDESLLITGSFFSEFSMYFLRYLSAILARGDNVVLVCSSAAQVEETYNYVEQGFAQLAGLFQGSTKAGKSEFDNPIWKIVQIKDSNGLQEAVVDECSVLVTSMNFLCSSAFEKKHGRFLHLIDTIVFVDALKTVNIHNRQLTMLNTRLRNITGNSAQLAKNGSVNKDFRVRYMSRPVRYIGFDASGSSGLDKALANLLGMKFGTGSVMRYNPNALVRCYRYEGRPGADGCYRPTQVVDTPEELGALANVALHCLQRGASSVTVFADEQIPYASIQESIASNAGGLDIRVDRNVFRMNKYCYDPDGYHVIIAMDTRNDLPAAIRRYLSMVSDEPTLIVIFSKPYLMRDYYLAHLDTCWGRSQLERIPVVENSLKDAANAILVKAGAGGISEEQILDVAERTEQLKPLADKKNINAILRAVLDIAGCDQSTRLELYKYFEYVSTRDFDENGNYCAKDRVVLRRRGSLYDMISGRDMVTLRAEGQEFVLPLPKNRLTQNHIAEQNLLYDGKIYYIDKIDTKTGTIHARLAVSGRNDENYQYVQAREYRVEMNPERVERMKPTKHAVVTRQDGEISVSDIYVSTFRAPMEVLTNGYYIVDCHTMSADLGVQYYRSISDPGQDERAKQTYRRYGMLTQETCSSEAVLGSSDLTSKARGAQMMSIRLTGQFGPDRDKTLALAAAMLNELLHAMYPSVADSVVVCPVYAAPIKDEDATMALAKQPRIIVNGESEYLSAADWTLVIIEDCAADLGVVSALSHDGRNAIKTLFEPIWEYLSWYLTADQKSEYLNFGLKHAPSCFDFESLHKLAALLADDKHEPQFVEVDQEEHYIICDFCGKRYAQDEEITELEDGRRICGHCADSIVGNDKRALEAHLQQAKCYLEDTYGISLEDDYQFCFESTVKIVNTLKKNTTLLRRGTEAPLKSYVDEDKKVHVENSIPSVNLSELLVRELTHMWQCKNLPELEEDRAEGHLALVAIQYLRFLNQNALASVRTAYYESTDHTSGEGYRKLVQALLANPQFSNNPFRYLMNASGTPQEEIRRPAQTIEPGALGLAYTPQQPDRVQPGQLRYFHYDRLSPVNQRAYEALLEAINGHKDEVYLVGCTAADITQVSHAVEYDHPELFWYRGGRYAGEKMMPQYGASAEEVRALQQRIDQVVAQYLEGIEPGMSAYDVALRIHARVIAAVDYDTIALERQKKEDGPPQDRIDYLRSICGVFLNGKAVCEGYARAVQYLLQKCGIECAEVVGDICKENGEPGGSHAWNILKLDGDYYQMDTTWDDSSNTVQMVKSRNLGFSYFCITSEEICRTRNLEGCPTEVPQCTATRANYYYHNDLVLERYDLDRIKAIANRAVANNCTFFTFKCASKEVYDEALERLFTLDKECGQVLRGAIGGRQSISYVWSHNPYVWTITVKFDEK